VFVLAWAEHLEMGVSAASDAPASFLGSFKQLLMMFVWVTWA
jgi:hypothetical protein